MGTKLGTSVGHLCQGYINFIFFLISAFSIFLLQSCSNENMVTQPTEKPANKTALAKTTTAPASSIDHSTDTVITLPKSGKTVVVSKTISADRIAKLDKYLHDHKNIPIQTQGVVPNALPCNYYFEYDWVLTSYYKAVPGKYLGIWTNIISPRIAYNSFGFTKFFVNNNTDIDSAYAGGFKYDSLMLVLDNYTTAFSKIDASNSGGRHVGSYYIDEPIERGTWYDALIEDVANYVYPKSMMLASYKWPVVPQYYSFPVTYGQMYGPIISSLSNINIMCDEYHGNCLGFVDDYWTEFTGYYGANKNLANWLHVVINNGNGTYNCVGTNNANSWLDMLGHANRSGMNEVWLYAQDTGDENAIISYCHSAWQTGWLLQRAVEFVTRWKCTSANPCTICSFPDYGTWVIDAAYYDGQVEYVGY